MHSFTCKNCGKKTRSSGIQQSEGLKFVTCEYCKAKNELLQLPTAEGAPSQFEVVRVLK